MAAQIDTATAMQLFDTLVTLKFQNSMKLQGTIEERHGTTGQIVNIPVSDLIEMHEGNFAPVDILPTPVNETNVPIVTNDYHVKTVIGGGEFTLFNFDKIVDHAKLHGLAGGRMIDFIKINALYTDANFANILAIPVNDGFNTGVNEGKMADGLSYLEDQGVDVQDYNISMWAPALQKAAMMADDRVVNFFYNDVKPLTDFRIQSYLGVDCRFLGSNGINKIPFTSNAGVNTYLVPMVAHDAMVQTFNRDLSTSVTWLPNQDRWELLSTLTSGAKIIQTNGIVLLTAQTPYVPN
jgi:hypothetical protein